MPDTTYPGPERIYRYQLGQGITLLIYENFAAESVVIEGLARAGALAESAQQAGLAGFTADCLMRGTQSRSFEEIYEALESVGAGLHFSGGRHMTEFSGGGLAEDLDLILDLLADSLRRPLFPEEQVEQVRGEIMTGLHIRANDTRQMASLAFYELLYKNHPYSQSVDGYLETISQISRDDLAQFHADYYGPSGMILAVVGAVKAETALDKVAAVLGDWEAGSQQALPPVPPATRPAMMVRSNVNMAQKSQSDILLGWPGPLRSAPDYMDASMANTILGVFGMMGRLGKKIREEQGLAYYAYSRLHGGLGPSPWYVSAGVAPDKVEQALADILQEIDRLCNEPVSPEELADSQAYRTGSMPVGLETNSGLASVIVDMELYQLGLDYLQRYPDLIAAVTPASIQAAAQNYLHSEQAAVAVAGPQNSLSEEESC